MRICVSIFCMRCAYISTCLCTKIHLICSYEAKDVARMGPLYPQAKSPWYQLDKRLGGHQSRSGRGGKEKKGKVVPVPFFN
jgi:hypothetical protein